MFSQTVRSKRVGGRIFFNIFLNRLYKVLIKTKKAATPEGITAISQRLY